MSKSKIAWTDETANWIVGCTKISAGCAHCYASTAANSARLQQFPQYKNVVDHKGNWNGTVEFVPKVLDDLLKGKRERRVFAPSMSDPFHPAVKDEWLDQFFAVVALTPHITYQVLTKRPERMYEYITNLLTEERFRSFCNEQSELLAAKKVSWPKYVFDPKTDMDDDDDLETCLENHLFDCLQQAFEESPDSEAWADQVLQNLHLGVTVENQSAANDRIPWLLKTPAAKRFLSVEPLLESIVFDHQVEGISEEGATMLHSLTGLMRTPYENDSFTNKIDWVIVGGESGKDARQFHLKWANSIRIQCKSAGVAFFMKQMGSNPFLGDQPLKLKSRSGTDISEWPQDLQVQEFI
jgi:protein gp37